MSTHRLGFVVPLLLATIGTLAVIAFVHPTLAAVVWELAVGNIVMVLERSLLRLAIQGLREIRA